MTAEIVRALPEGLQFKSGAHSSFEEGCCVMEAVAYVAGEAFSDHPACACPVVSAVCRSFNDRLATDARRTELLAPLVAQLLGSKSTREIEWRRVWMLFDFCVRTLLPRLLDARGHKKEANGVRGIGEITDRSSAITARDFLRREILALALALALARDLALALALDRARDLDLALALALDRARDLDLALDLALEADWVALIKRMLAVTS